jgi:hypothetical protein
MVTRYFKKNVGLIDAGRKLSSIYQVRIKYIMVCVLIAALFRVGRACASSVGHGGMCQKKSRSSALPAVCGCGPSMKPAFLEPELGGDRLGIPSRLAPARGATPEEAQHVLSEEVLSGGRCVDIPPAMRDVPGDITSVLTQSAFVSFTRSANIGSEIAGIRGTMFPPMSLRTSRVM